MDFRFYTTQYLGVFDMKHLLIRSMPELILKSIRIIKHASNIPYLPQYFEFVQVNKKHNTLNFFILHKLRNIRHIFMSIPPI